MVGGGLAGLTAAVFMARAGRKVVVLERAGELGGRAMTLEKNGFSTNLGPHALYAAGAGARTLKELGIGWTGGEPPTSGLLAFDGGSMHVLPSGPLSLFTTKLFGLRGKLAAGRALQAITRKATATLQRMTLREWLDNAVAEPAARRLVEALFRLATYTHAPESLSAGAAIDQLKLALAANVRYVDGGWRTLVEALRGEAARLGVDIRTRARALAVEIEGGLARGVRLDGGEVIGASAVLVATGPKAARSLFGEDATLEAWVSSATPVRASCLDLALSSLPRPRALFALGIDRPLYFSVHSASAKLAPEGGALIHVAKYLEPGAPVDAAGVEKELEELCERAQPGFKDVIVDRGFRPEMVVTNALVTAPAGGTAGRPGPALPTIGNVFFAGDWIGPEGMLADASFASARAAAELALKAPARASA